VLALRSFADDLNRHQTGWTPMSKYEESFWVQATCLASGELKLQRGERARSINYHEDVFQPHMRYKPNPVIGPDSMPWTGGADCDMQLG
jgi:hypothetical protein